MGKTKTEVLKAERDAVIAKSVRTAMDLFVAEATGHTIRDVEGREYVDFTGGIGVHTTGHRPESVVRAVKKQLDRYLHLCVMVFNYEPYVELAKRLLAIAPMKDAKSAFFNSGSEAVENGVKTARAYTKRPGVISFRNSFHGRTFMCLSLTGKYRPYKVGFEPFMPHVYQASFPYHYRCADRHDASECAQRSLDTVEDIFHSQAAADKVAAIITEPVQGEGGFIVPPKEFFPGLRKICDAHGIVLIDDEVQAGIGRTGKMFAIEHFRTTPDLITTAKALGAGLPISGLTGKAEIMDAPVPGSIGGTYGGNPLACVAAIENLKLIEKALTNAPKVARLLERRLDEIAEEHALVGEHRGLGPMRAIELVKDRATKVPAADEAKAVQREARERGALFLTAGTFDNVIRLLPPLTTPADVLEKGLDVLDAAMAAVERTGR